MVRTGGLGLVGEHPVNGGLKRTAPSGEIHNLELALDFGNELLHRLIAVKPETHALNVVMGRGELDGAAK